MLNKESRLYFQRAFASSNVAFDSYENHTQHIQNCAKLNGTEQLIEYLKTENCSSLIECGSLRTPDQPRAVWSPVIESNNTNGAFLTKKLDDIYNDPNEVAQLIMDTMFSFTAQVHRSQ